MDKNTFNVSILFGNGRAIGTIVCHSSQTIDQGKIQQLVNRKICTMIQTGEMCQSPKKIVETIAACLSKNVDGLQTVIVPTDACVAIQYIPMRQTSDGNAETE